jgi:hypothetical protein
MQYSLSRWYKKAVRSAPSAALQSGLKKIGEQLTADWLKKAGTEGEAVIAAYKK